MGRVVDDVLGRCFLFPGLAGVIPAQFSGQQVDDPGKGVDSGPRVEEKEAGPAAKDIHGGSGRFFPGPVEDFCGEVRVPGTQAVAVAVFGLSG